MRAKYAAMAVITILLPLVLIEAGLRLFLSGWIDQHLDDASRLEANIDEIILRKTVDGREVFHSPFLPTKYYRDLPDSGDDTVGVIKAPRGYRILIFGGSSAAGSPFGHWASFPRFLDDALRSARWAGAEVEVMNFGMSSASTGTVRLLLETLPDLGPDLVVIYAGFNEIRDSTASVATAGWGKRMAERAGTLLFDHLYAYRASAVLAEYADTVLAKGRSIHAAYPCPGRSRLLRDRREWDVMNAQYRDNISTVIGLAKGMGAEVLLLGQVSNLVMPPTKVEEANAGQAAAMKAVEDAIAVGDQAAFRVAREGLRQDKAMAGRLPYYDGLAALRQGNYDEARRPLQRATDMDPQPTRYRSDYTEIMSRLAAGDQAVHFVDVNAHLGSLVTDGIADGRVILDMMHPTIELNRFIADLIIDRHLAARNVRPDVFDFGRPRAPLPFVEEELYVVACRRYYETAVWDACLKRALDDLDQAMKQNRLGENRAALRVWESLYYYGRVHGDDEMQARALALFRSPAAEMRGENGEIR